MTQLINDAAAELPVSNSKLGINSKAVCTLTIHLCINF
jgi:hypothetical protein